MEEDHQQEGFNREDMFESTSPFDQLARGLADGTISRGQSLKLIGAAIVGGFLGTFALPAESEAKKKKKGKKKRKKKSQCQEGEVPCAGNCCVPGTICCE